MPKFAAQLGMQAATQAASGLVGTGLGLLLEGHNDRRQLRQQEKLQNLEIKGSKELTDYNAAKQLQMWKDTNYPAQIEQMKQAGLNPALAYGMGGGGGVTANVATGKTSGGQAPTGGGELLAAQAMGLQLRMQEAQIKNLNADTNLKNADAKNKPLQGQNIEASTASVLQGVENAKAQKKLTEIQTDIQKLDLKFNDYTYELRASQINYEISKINEEISILETQKLLDRETAEAKKNILQAEVYLKVAQTALTNSQKINIEANTQKTLQDIINSIEQLKINQGQLTNEQAKTELHRIQDIWTRSGLPKWMKDIMGNIKPR